MIYLLFIGIAVPMSISLFILKGREQVIMIFLLLGLFMCLFAAEINGYLLNIMDCTYFHYTTTVSPIIEEIVKAAPIIFFACVFNDDKRTLMAISMAIGIGFAILENVNYFVSSGSYITLDYAITRGFGSGLMHGIATFIVGIGVSYTHKRRKLFIPGSFGLISAAAMFHGIYNALVQSPPYDHFAVALPLLIFIPGYIILRRSKVIGTKQ